MQLSCKRNAIWRPMCMIAEWIDTQIQAFWSNHQPTNYLASCYFSFWANNRVSYFAEFQNHSWLSRGVLAILLHVRRDLVWNQEKLLLAVEIAFDAAGLTSKRNLLFEIMARSNYHLAIKTFHRGIGIKSLTQYGIGIYMLRLPRKIFNASVGTISAHDRFLAHGASDLLNGKINQGPLSRQGDRSHNMVLGR